MYAGWDHASGLMTRASAWRQHTAPPVVSTTAHWMQITRHLPCDDAATHFVTVTCSLSRYRVTRGYVWIDPSRSTSAPSSDGYSVPRAFRTGSVVLCVAASVASVHLASHFAAWQAEGTVPMHLQPERPRFCKFTQVHCTLDGIMLIKASALQ